MTGPQKSAYALMAQAIREYGTAIRLDWGSIDGRAERSALHAFADLLERGQGVELQDVRMILGVCPYGGAHWDEGRCDSTHANGDYPAGSS